MSVDKESLGYRLRLGNWPTERLLELDQAFRTKAPELGVELMVESAGGGYWVLRRGAGSAPGWLDQLTAMVTIGAVLRIVSEADLMAIDAAWRLGGAMAIYQLAVPTLQT